MFKTDTARAFPLLDCTPVCFLYDATVTHSTLLSLRLFFPFSSFVSSIGGAFRIISASRVAPSRPRPRPLLIVIALVPLAPTPLTRLTSPSRDTCRTATTPRHAASLAAQAARSRSQHTQAKTGWG